jgi:hypothetical protein
MKRSPLSLIVLFLLFSINIFSQQITCSDNIREDTKDMVFEIIGNLNGNFIIYKNIRWKHNFTVYDNQMQVIEKIPLDFMPDKTLNVDFVPGTGQFYMVYQFQKKGILYCMGAKINANGKITGEPFEMDTTKISVFANNKIYSTVLSEDKQKVLIYKIQKKNEKLYLSTLLFDNQLVLQKKSRFTLDFDERSEVLNDLQVDNQGNIIFTKGYKPANRDYFNELELVTKSVQQDTLNIIKVALDKKYIDNIELKIDNLNKQYLINSFYYKERRGNIEGIFAFFYKSMDTSKNITALIPFSDSLREQAKKDGQLRFAFNDFFIRQVIVKKDGGYILTAEDYSSQSRGMNNSWSRYDYLYSPYTYQYDYYYYNSPFNGYYRPYGNYGNQSTRYYYDNILILSMDKNGKLQWANIINKEQFDDDNDNFLSYGTLNAGTEINFLFNEGNKNPLVALRSMAPDGTVKRNPPLKSEAKGLHFMPRFIKQTGFKQVLIPCASRTGNILFAKIDF